MIEQQEISNINELLTGQTADIKCILNQYRSRKDKDNALDYTIYYIGAISRVIFSTEILDDDKKEMLFRMISDLTELNPNIGNTLFEQVPSAFLFQLLISLKKLGINIEPLIRNVDFTNYENGLTNLQVLGDFTDQQFIDNLLIFYSKFDKHLYQKALHDIAIQAAKVNNVIACEKLIDKIKDCKIKSEVQGWLANAYLRTGETQNAIEIVELSHDKAALFSTISSFFLRSNKYQEALNLLTLDADPEIKFEIIVNIIHYHIEHHTLKIVDVLFDQAIEQKDQIRDHFTQAVFTSKLAEIALKLGRVKVLKTYISEILDIVENKLDFKTGCLAFNDLFTRLAVNENYDLADELLLKRWSFTQCTGQMELSSSHTEDVSLTILTILNRIDILASDGKVKNHIEIERLHACTLTSLMFLKDTEDENYLLLQIAFSYAKNRCYGDACFILKNIDDKDYKNNLAARLPLYALSNGDIKQAKELIDKIDTYQIKIDTQLILAPYFFKNGFQKDAIEFIKNWSLYKRHNEYV